MPSRESARINKNPAGLHAGVDRRQDPRPLADRDSSTTAPSRLSIFLREASLAYPDRVADERVVRAARPSRVCTPGSARPPSTPTSVAACSSNSTATGAIRPGPRLPCSTARRSIACCKTYFDSVNLGRPKTDDELIDLFRFDLAEAEDSGGVPARALRKAGNRTAAGFPCQAAHASIAARFCTPKNRLRFTWARPRWPDASIASTAGRWQRRHRRLQDGQGSRSGRCRREPAAFALRHRRA